MRKKEQRKMSKEPTVELRMQPSGGDLTWCVPGYDKIKNQLTGCNLW